MTWRLTKVEELREYLVKSYISKLASMSELCEECGVSRKKDTNGIYKNVTHVGEQG